MTADRFPDLLPDRPTTGAGSPKTDHLQDGAGARIPSSAAHFVPSILRRAGMAVTSPVTRASGAHLEPVEPEDDRKIPKFLRRHGVAHAQPIASDRESSEGPHQSRSGFVQDRQVTSVVTMPNPPVAGSTCPLCGCRVPARANAADRQRASRERRRNPHASVPTPLPGPNEGDDNAA
jgi:hypothetical protein